MKNWRLISIGLLTTLILLIFSIVENGHQMFLAKPAQAEYTNDSPITLNPNPYKGNIFEIWIIEGYQHKVIAGVSTIESPEGNLAYTVVVKPQINEQQLSNQTLAQIAINEFAKGENFKPGEFETVTAGEIT